MASSVLIAVLIFIPGIILISYGAELLLEGIEDFARYYNLSGVILAILVMGIDPEESVASISASVADLSGVAVGNVIGNSIISLALIFSLPGLIKPYKLHQIDGVYMGIMFAAGIPVLLAVLDPGRIAYYGVLSLLIYGGFVYRNLKKIGDHTDLKRNLVSMDIDEDTSIIDLIREHDKNAVPVIVSPGEKNGENCGGDIVNGDDGKMDDDGEKEKSPIKILLSVVLGAIMIYFGSDFLIESSISIITETSLSEGVFGMIIIAFSTNIEEFSILFTALKKDLGHIGIGAMIGKVIWNFGITFGISALILGSSDKFGIALLLNAFILCLGITPLFIYLVRKKVKIDRKISTILLAFFTLYLIIAIRFGM